METVIINGKVFTIPVEVKDTIDGFFNVHETFMVTLCEILKLDYTLATEDSIVMTVKSIMNSQKKTSPLHPLKRRHSAHRSRNE